VSAPLCPGVGSQPRLYWGPNLHLRHQPEIFLGGFATRPDNILRAWSSDAPNMTADDLIATRVYSPQDIEGERPNMVQGEYSTGSTIASQLGRIRPVPEMAGDRVLLDNLYGCSATLHSGPGIGRGSSHNCFREIARALRLDGAAAAV